MAIVQTDIPMTSRMSQQIIQELTQRYPFLVSEQLITTAYGRPVTALSLGRGNRRVLYTAAHHANEWITATVILKFLEELCEAVRTGDTVYGVPADTIMDNCAIFAVPLVNPDGVDLVTGEIEPGELAYEAAHTIADHYPAIPFPSGWKANLLGVDLNLQYPAGWLQAREIKFSQGFFRPAPRDYVGRAPLNQRETIALAQYTEDVDPALVLAYHTQGNVIYWQFRDYQVPGAKELAAEFSKISGYALADTPYDSAFAGYKDWFIQTYRRPGFTIECGSGENPLPLSQFQEIYKRNLGILVTAALGLPET
ncbi:MAG: M14 family metallocarboxypeptidase [Oscillospiraceae bacterium]|nr:M14 family metallocarboxypeptidase [Oscillospiraceae bacterium]